MVELMINIFAKAHLSRQNIPFLFDWSYDKNWLKIIKERSVILNIKLTQADMFYSFSFELLACKGY